MQIKWKWNKGYGKLRKKSSKELKWHAKQKIGAKRETVKSNLTERLFVIGWITTEDKHAGWGAGEGAAAPPVSEIFRAKRSWFGQQLSIFGIITVSLGVRIVNVFVFTAIWVRLYPDFNTHAFGHCVIFSGKKVTAPSPKSEGARTLMQVHELQTLILRQLKAWKSLQAMKKEKKRGKN